MHTDWNPNSQATLSSMGCLAVASTWDTDSRQPELAPVGGVVDTVHTSMLVEPIHTDSTSMHAAQVGPQDVQCCSDAVLNCPCSQELLG